MDFMIICYRPKQLLLLGSIFLNIEDLFLEDAEIEASEITTSLARLKPQVVMEILTQKVCNIIL